MANNKILVVIGGGAAGFFCAVNAAQMNTNLKVILLEKTDKLLSKVKVSGGGRCNVTHHCFSIAEMVKKYPRGSNFLKKAFNHFFTKDTVEWFEQRGVKLKAEEDGRMFPISNSSQTIINCLLQEADKFNVEIRLKSDVKSIEKNNEQLLIATNEAKKIIADYVCVATGGYPKSFMFDWLLQLGHTIEKPLPSLFTFNLANKDITTLMGVSVENVAIKISNTKLAAQGPLLITHWGFSGPAVLKLSAFGAIDLAAMQYHYNININWLSAYTEQTLKEKILALRFQLATQKMINRNPFQLPQRLWEYFLKECGISNDLRWTDLPAKEQNKLCNILTNNIFEIKGKTTFKEEFVTCGGIKLNEIDANTMQSKIMPQLFFAGEVLNVDGITGGFNFQNAWTTGWVAANAIANIKQ